MGMGRHIKSMKNELKRRRNISIAHMGKKLSKEHIHNIAKSHRGRKHSEERKINIGLGNKGKVRLEKDKKRWSEKHKIRFKNNPKLRERMKELRMKQILPTKDTTIEVKIQDFLKQLGIEFFTHHYMKIEHGYQCDILIPAQKGFPKKTIIECDGDYWHGNPDIKYFKNLTENQIKQKELDYSRTKELIAKGFRVIRIWENEINHMELNEFVSTLNGVTK